MVVVLFLGHDLAAALPHRVTERRHQRVKVGDGRGRRAAAEHLPHVAALFIIKNVRQGLRTCWAVR